MDSSEIAKERLRASHAELRRLIEGGCMPSRETSEAVDSLDLSLMWALESVDRNGANDVRAGVK